MPELPEVEAVVRKLKADATGAVIRSTDVLRARCTAPQDPEALHQTEGYTIRRVVRRGKNIILNLAEPSSLPLALRVHLGMTGNFYVIPDARLFTANVRVRFALTDGRGLVLEDLRLFGRVHVFTPTELKRILACIGMEPLSSRFTPNWFLALAQTSKKPAKVFLMEQSGVAGLGNIYSAEALFRAGINPLQPLSKVPRKKLLALHGAIRGVLQDAIKRTVRAYRDPGYFREMRYDVYGRSGDPCHACGDPIQRTVQAGRSTYFCGSCQR